jgi:hypothetical protein
MKQRHCIFRRENGIFYSLDNLTRIRNSLNTADPQESRGLKNALNEACQQPAVNLQIAQVYLQHSDPEFARRTWRCVLDRILGQSESRGCGLAKPNDQSYPAKDWRAGHSSFG